MTTEQKAKEYGENPFNQPKSEAMIPLSLKEAYMVGYEEGYAEAMRTEAVPSCETIKKHLFNE